jgi:hypothetical protein
MTTAHIRRVRYGLNFGMSLVLSWIFSTPLIGFAYLSGSRTREELAMWVSLWVFTVGVPTMQAYRVHRRLNELLQVYPGLAHGVRRDLAHTRFVLLMCGSMTVLIVMAIEWRRNHP